MLLNEEAAVHTADVVIIKRDITEGSDLGAVNIVAGVQINGVAVPNARRVTVDSGDVHELMEVTVSFLATDVSFVEEVDAEEEVVGLDPRD